MLSPAVHENAVSWNKGLVPNIYGDRRCADLGGRARGAKFLHHSDAKQVGYVWVAAVLTRITMA